jgi:hypothetical protein
MGAMTAADVVLFAALIQAIGCVAVPLVAAAIEHYEEKMPSF